MTFQRLTGPGKKRLRRVARACQDYGIRAQKSLFECQLRKVEWAAFKNRLLKEIDPAQDSLRIYHLDETARNKMEHYGLKKPVDLNEPLIY